MTDRQVFKQCSLKKQGGSNGGWKTWKRRWFVLDSEGLSYYQSEKAYLNGDREKGFLHWDHNFDIVDHDESEEKFFKVVTTSRTMIMKADTLPMKKEWLELGQRIRELGLRGLQNDGAEEVSPADILSKFEIDTNGWLVPSMSGAGSSSGRLTIGGSRTGRASVRYRNMSRADRSLSRSTMGGVGPMLSNHIPSGGVCLEPGHNQLRTEFMCTRSEEALSADLGRQLSEYVDRSPTRYRLSYGKTSKLTARVHRGNCVQNGTANSLSPPPSPNSGAAVNKQGVPFLGALRSGSGSGSLSSRSKTSVHTSSVIALMGLEDKPKRMDTDDEYFTRFGVVGDLNNLLGAGDEGGQSFKVKSKSIKEGHLCVMQGRSWRVRYVVIEMVTTGNPGDVERGAITRRKSALLANGDSKFAESAPEGGPSSYHPARRLLTYDNTGGEKKTQAMARLSLYAKPLDKKPVASYDLPIGKIRAYHLDSEQFPRHSFSLLTPRADGTLDEEGNPAQEILMFSAKTLSAEVEWLWTLHTTCKTNVQLPDLNRTQRPASESEGILRGVLAAGSLKMSSAVVEPVLQLSDELATAFKCSCKSEASLTALVEDEEGERGAQPEASPAASPPEDSRLDTDEEEMHPLAPEMEEVAEVPEGDVPPIVLGEDVVSGSETASESDLGDDGQVVSDVDYSESPSGSDVGEDEGHVLSRKESLDFDGLKQTEQATDEVDGTPEVEIMPAQQAPKKRLGPKRDSSDHLARRRPWHKKSVSVMMGSNTDSLVRTSRSGSMMKLASSKNRSSGGFSGQRRRKSSRRSSRRSSKGGSPSSRSPSSSGNGPQPPRHAPPMPVLNKDRVDLFADAVRLSSYFDSVPAASDDLAAAGAHSEEESKLLAAVRQCREMECEALQKVASSVFQDEYMSLYFDATLYARLAYEAELLRAKVVRQRYEEEQSRNATSTNENKDSTNDSTALPRASVTSSTISMVSSSGSSGMDAQMQSIVELSLEKEVIPRSPSSSRKGGFTPLLNPDSMRDWTCASKTSRLMKDKTPLLSALRPTLIGRSIQEGFGSSDKDLIATVDHVLLCFGILIFRRYIARGGDMEIAVPIRIRNAMKSALTYRCRVPVDLLVAQSTKYAIEDEDGEFRQQNDLEDRKNDSRDFSPRMSFSRLETMDLTRIGPSVCVACAYKTRTCCRLLPVDFCTSLQQYAFVHIREDILPSYLSYVTEVNLQCRQPIDAVEHQPHLKVPDQANAKELMDLITDVSVTSDAVVDRQFRASFFLNLYLILGQAVKHSEAGPLLDKVLPVPDDGLVPRQELSKTRQGWAVRTFWWHVCGKWDVAVEQATEIGDQSLFQASSDRNDAKRLRTKLFASLLHLLSITAEWFSCYPDDVFMLGSSNIMLVMHRWQAQIRRLRKAFGAGRRSQGSMSMMDVSCQLSESGRVNPFWLLTWKLDYLRLQVLKPVSKREAEWLAGQKVWQGVEAGWRKKRLAQEKEEEEANKDDASGKKAKAIRDKRRKETAKPTSEPRAVLFDTVARELPNELSRVDGSGDTLQSGSDGSEGPELTLLSLSPRDLAVHMTYIDQQMFRAVESREFTGRQWTKDPPVPERHSAHIVRLIERYNRRCHWVVSEVVSLGGDRLQSQRLRLMKFFIDVMGELEKLNNWSALFALSSAFNMTALYRLRTDWGRVGTSYVARVKAFRDGLCSGNRNYRLYRQRWRASQGKSQVPAFAVVLKDCFLLEELPTIVKQSRRSRTTVLGKLGNGVDGALTNTSGVSTSVSVAAVKPDPKTEKMGSEDENKLLDAVSTAMINVRKFVKQYKVLSEVFFAQKLVDAESDDADATGESAGDTDTVEQKSESKEAGKRASTDFGDGVLITPLGRIDKRIVWVLDKVMSLPAADTDKLYDLSLECEPRKGSR